MMNPTNVFSRVRLSVLLLCLVVIILPTTGAAQSGEGDQPFYDKVVRLKDGTVIKNVEVIYEQEEGQYERYVIKTRTGEIIRKLPSEILIIETHSRTFLPPEYNPFGIVTPCDDRQRERNWYFVELRLWGYITGEDESSSQIGLDGFTFGPEAVFGLRFGAFGVGLGAGYFNSNDINRFPFFLHGRYQLSMHCFAPFLFVQAGTVFDDQSGETLAPDDIFSTGPKLVSVGIGVDFPLSSVLDFSADLGYRYLQLPTSVPCDCSNRPELEEAIYYNESHGLLLRLGVTF